MSNSETAQKIRTRVILDRNLYNAAAHIAVDEGPGVSVRQLIARALQEFVDRRRAEASSSA